MFFLEKDSSLSRDIFLKWVRKGVGRTKEMKVKVVKMSKPIYLAVNPAPVKMETPTSLSMTKV